MEKSASKTTLAQGPGHCAGGVTEKGFGEKSANVIAVKSGTVQGVVLGLVTGGSAVAVLADPIVKPGAGMLCAATPLAKNNTSAAIQATFIALRGFPAIAVIPVFPTVKGLQ